MNTRKRNADSFRRQRLASLGPCCGIWLGLSHAAFLSGMLAVGVVSAVLRNNPARLRPADPLAYRSAIGMFVFIVAVAVSVPAHRAVRIKAAEALRHK